MRATHLLIHRLKTLNGSLKRFKRGLKQFKGDLKEW